MNNNSTQDEGRFGMIESMENERKGLQIHMVVFLCVSALLTTINLVLCPGFLWSLLPVVGMGIGLAFHYFNAKQQS